MNRFITVGLAIAIAPAIFLALGLMTESPETVALAELVLFNAALPLAALLVPIGLLVASRKPMVQGLGYQAAHRLVRIGLAIAVAPAILVAYGWVTTSPETLERASFVWFGIALPLGAVLVLPL